MKIFSDKKLQIRGSYLIAFLVIFFCVVMFVQNANLNDFLTSIENRTFDLRQSVLVKSNSKKINKDIVLITVDNASYEYLLGRYGEWPIPRGVYAKLIDYLEMQHPKSIAFDLMFIKSMKSRANDDAAIIKAITTHDNVYTSMNFDDTPYDVRKPVVLPDDLSVKVKNDSGADFSINSTFKNCRPILPQILNGTSNVGIINVTRASDGILRKVPPFMVYQGKFYPYLSLMVSLKALGGEKGNIRDFYIDKDYNLKVLNRTIPVDKDGGVILNWYGHFPEVPLYKLIKVMDGDKSISQYDFKDKIIYIGVTATSLYDIKSVPTDKNYPGVEVHTTFVNNFINNDFIKKADVSLDVLISLFLAVIVGIIVFKAPSTFMALTSTILTVLGYIIFTYYMMKFFNLWVGIVFPVLSLFLVFIAAYIIKYILKSRDFEHQYKLATTDGLTELYNHRYFQEQMLVQVDTCKRYNSGFSLILIDIDFFKKFNDSFGHQSGDAVLRQVSQRLKKNVRSTDFVCRYGGEEMSIILPNTDKEEAIITAEKLCRAVSETPCKLINNQEGTVTISLGVATFPQDGETADAIIEAADKHLYFAKENGRNRVGA